MGLVQGAIRIDCDSQSAIFLAKNPTYLSKTKHIDVQYHFVRVMIEDKRVLSVKVDTLKYTVDALTKSVSFEKFSWCRETMCILGLKKGLSSPMAPCGKKTTSGRMLGCVIFFPRLTYVVNRGVRGEVEPLLCCTNCTAGRGRGSQGGFEGGG